NDCNGQIDCADPACNSTTECVPDESGWQLGTLVAPGTPVGGNCPTHYTAQATFVGNGVDSPTTCTGCSCTGTVDCSVTISQMAAATCPSGALTGATTTAHVAACDNNNNATNGWDWTTTNVRLSGATATTSCDCSGTPAPTAASFTTSNDFCATTQ